MCIASPIVLKCDVRVCDVEQVFFLPIFFSLPFSFSPYFPLVFTHWYFGYRYGICEKILKVLNYLVIALKIRELLFHTFCTVVSKLSLLSSSSYSTHHKHNLLLGILVQFVNTLIVPLLFYS